MSAMAVLTDEGALIDRLLAALAAHRKGAIAEAEAMYRDVLAEAPGHAAALRLLGMLLLGDGRAPRAVDILRRAVAAKDDDPEAQTALADALFASGERAGAIAQYRAVLARWPGQVAARVNLANALRDAGDPDAAIAECRLALAIAPRLVAAHITMGASLLSAGRDVEAIGAYRTAVETAPDNPVARAGLGLAMLRDRRAVDGLEAASRATELAPNFAEAWYVRGLAERLLARHPAARASLERAVAIAPNHAEAQLALGNTLADLDEGEPAVAAIRAAIAADPALAEAPASLSAVLQGLGQPEDAATAADAAIALRPDFPEAMALRGTARLMQGDFGGFADFTARRAGRRLADGPAWDGAAPAGRRLLVLGEEGFGDVIQFARFLPVLAALGADVTLACQPSLVPLLAAQGIRCVDIAAPWPAHDAWVWMMDLPLRLGTTLDTLPGAAGYLAAPNPAHPVTAPQIPPRRVGLAWAGNPEHRNDARRSLPTAALAPLAALKSLDWVNLQQDGRGPELTIMHRMPAPKRFADWSATAREVATLDLVIAADTAIAHLAGALGRPVWLLLPHAAAALAE